MADTSKLHPNFKGPFEKVLRSFLNVTGHRLIVTSTIRTLEEQARLYRQGVSTDAVNLKAQGLRNRGYNELADILIAVGPVPTSNKVTNAGPGESWHNWGMAADVVPIVNGHAVWDSESPLWGQYGSLVKMNGLYWGDSFGDLPHCQLFEEGNPLNVFSPDEVRGMTQSFA